MSRSPRDKQARAIVAVDQGSLASDGTLLGATVGAGLLAGLFWSSQVSVVRGLADVADDAYVAAFRAINRRIQNPWFLSVFLGTGPLTLAAWALNRRRVPPAPALIATSTVLNGIVVAVTMAGNVPLNNALDTRGAVASLQGDARSQFEAPWNRLNLVRAVAAAGSFGALALATHGSARAAE